MVLLSLYPNQDENLLKEFVKNLKEPYIIFSYKPLSWTKTEHFSPGEMPPPDDSLNIFYQFLSSYFGKEWNDEFTIIDWTCVDLERDIKKLKKTQVGFEIIEENIKVQDFRLAPFMENLLKICYEIKLVGTERLFKTNPKVLFPKLLKGNKHQLITALGTFLNTRALVRSKNFTGTIPIFNSEFFICN